MCVFCIRRVPAAAQGEAARSKHGSPPPMGCVDWNRRGPGRGRHSPPRGDGCVTYMQMCCAIRMRIRMPPLCATIHYCVLNRQNPYLKVSTQGRMSVCLLRSARASHGRGARLANRAGTGTSSAK